jgi:hypothetical protein
VDRDQPVGGHRLALSLQLERLTRYLTPATERFITLLVAASVDHANTYPDRS